MDLTLNGPQWQAFEAMRPGATVVMPWSRGTGKSWFQRNWFWTQVAKYDGKRTVADHEKTGVRGVFLMDTLKHFRDVHAREMLVELEGPWSFLGGKVNKSTLCVEFPGGSWLQPFPAAEHTSKAGRGIRCDVALLDECDDILESVLASVAIPWFSAVWSLRMLMLAGTPRKGRAGLLYRMHEHGLSDAPDFAHVHTFPATYRDCPETVDPRAVEKARNEMPPSVFRREWECDFDAAEGLVYEMWSDAFHVRRPEPGTVFSRCVVGVDWGYRDPAVILVIGISGHGQDATAYVLSEYCRKGAVLADLVAEAQRIRQDFPTAHWFADPSQPASIETLKRDAGVYIDKADNKIDQGVACVSDLLFVRSFEADGSTEKSARLYVAPECKNLREEFVNYRRKPLKSNPDDYGDEIIDKSNHCLDAARYALVGAFGFPGATRTEWTGSFGV